MADNPAASAAPETPAAGAPAAPAPGSAQAPTGPSLEEIRAQVAVCWVAGAPESVPPWVGSAIA